MLFFGTSQQWYVVYELVELGVCHPVFHQNNAHRTKKSRIRAHSFGENWRKKYWGVQTRIAVKDGGTASQTVLLKARGHKQKIKG
jgi:hypothetical protein